MIVTCLNCNASLQIDETKATTERFTIRCPKCQSSIAVQINRNGSNDTIGQRNWDMPSAAAFNKNAEKKEENLISANSADLMRALAAFQQVSQKQTGQPSHVQRRVLVCLNPESSQRIAPLLDNAGYEVFIAENPAQATEKIRDEEVDIMIYSPDFAVKFSGASILQQMINSLLTNQRRKIFVVAVEEGSQTFNTHEAFLRNLNLIVNTNDLHHLPSILHRGLRDFDELYRHFNQAINMAN